jgi:hypothetical protein
MTLICGGPESYIIGYFYCINISSNNINNKQYQQATTTSTSTTTTTAAIIATTTTATTTAWQHNKFYLGWVKGLKKVTNRGLSSGNSNFCSRGCSLLLNLTSGTLGEG